VYSARTTQEILYRKELEDLASTHRAVTITLTRQPPGGWPGRQGRVDGDLLAEVGWPPRDQPLCYVCGPTPFVESAADALVAAGHTSANIRTERFGPTGRE
jgi:ferredoxin-NADP reductase